jgi:hypothetical protein
MGRIATVTDAEGKLPKEHDEATLWETDEAALRFVLEDGKLNLCLRNMVDFKNFEKDKYKNQISIRQDFLPKCDKFERGLGIVLRNAWSHVEAIQTTDIPLLLSYCEDVLTFANDNKEFVERRVVDKTLCDRQEVVCVSYVRGLLCRIDDVGEDRIMGYLKEKKLFSRILTFASTWWKQLNDESLIVLAETLSAIILTEDFVTFKQDYCDDTDGRNLCQLEEEEWLEEVCDEDDVRKKLRPLLDLTRTEKRARK